MQSYFFRVMAMAVDQHPCLKPVLRDALLKGVERWKQLQMELLQLQWHGFAFGFQRAEVALGAPKAEESLEAGAYWSLDTLSGDSQW